jgi:hypothetical protein
MHGLQNERARELVKEKQFEARILASRPESNREAAPTARLSRRAWLLLALAGVVIVGAIILATLL